MRWIWALLNGKGGNLQERASEMRMWRACVLGVALLGSGLFSQIGIREDNVVVS